MYTLTPVASSTQQHLFEYVYHEYHESLEDKSVTFSHNRVIKKKLGKKFGEVIFECLSLGFGFAYYCHIIGLGEALHLKNVFFLL